MYKVPSVGRRDNSAAANSPFIPESDFGGQAQTKGGGGICPTINILTLNDTVRYQVPCTKYQVWGDTTKNKSAGIPILNFKLGTPTPVIGHPTLVLSPVDAADNLTP